MTTATMLSHVRRAIARLETRSTARFVGYGERAECAEDAAAIAWLLKTHPLAQPLPKFDERGADAQIACTVASKARRQLEAMGMPRQHIKGWATRTHGKGGVAELPAVKDKETPR